jgi:hypothetical protein
MAGQFIRGGGKEMVRKLLLTIFPVLFLVSCNFFFATPFPAELPNYTGYLKLSGSLNYSVYRINFVNGNCFLACGGDLSNFPNMIIVNSSMNVVNSGMPGTFGNLVMMEASNDKYLVGNVVLNSDLSVTTGTGMPFMGKTAPQNYGFTAKDGSGILYHLVLVPNSGSAALNFYTSTWGTSVAKTLSFPGLNISNAAVDPDPEAMLILILNTTPNDTYEVFGLPLFGTTGLFGSGSTTYPFGLTPLYLPSSSLRQPAYAHDGVVYGEYGSGLILKKWNSETVPSYFGQQSSGDLIINFDSSGTNWFMYDRQKQILTRGKKWW